jgi:hypothetical protein
VAGNITIDVTTSPMLFFIKQRQLYQLTNETSILAINVLNTTTTAELPLKLVAETKPGGVKGSWEWHGSMLQFNHGSKSNQGIFYNCAEDTAGGKGIYMVLNK